MNHECTCETEGFCTFCRSMPRMDEVETKSMSEVLHPYTLCHWCEKNITYAMKYTLGNFNDNNKVCGINCPKRKAQSPPKRSEYEVDVVAERRVYVRATDATNAQEIAINRSRIARSSIWKYRTTRVMPRDGE